jgi:hypothetical protein
MRFLGVNSSLVNLIEKKDSTNNEKTEYYSLDDIRGYKVYTALLTQSGTDAPVATVLENTLGDITFTVDGEGTYNAISDGLFTINKTTSILSSTISTSSNTTIAIDINTINIYTTSSDNLQNSLFEIRVYN